MQVVVEHGHFNFKYHKKQSLHLFVILKGDKHQTVKGLVGVRFTAFSCVSSSPSVWFISSDPPSLPAASRAPSSSLVLLRQTAVSSSCCNHSAPLSVSLKKQHVFKSLINLECNFFPVKKSVLVITQHFFRSVHIPEHNYPSAGVCMREETSALPPKIPSSFSLSEHMHTVKLLITVCTVIQRENSGK